MCLVVLLLQNVILYFELAVFTGCVAAFMFQIDQVGNNNGLTLISANLMDIEGLLKLSGRASDAFMIKCFCLPQLELTIDFSMIEGKKNFFVFQSTLV